MGVGTVMEAREVSGFHCNRARKKINFEYFFNAVTTCIDYDLSEAVECRKLTDDALQKHLLKTPIAGGGLPIIPFDKTSLK